MPKMQKGDRIVECGDAMVRNLRRAGYKPAAGEAVPEQTPEEAAAEKEAANRAEAEAKATEEKIAAREAEGKPARKRGA